MTPVINRDPGSPIATLIHRGKRIVIAHRGASGERPENTVEAFRLAIDQGADALEMDVRVSADGIPVIVHDPTTGRMGNTDVAVDASCAATLRGIDAGHGFSDDDGRTHPWRGRGLVIPTLSDVLEQFQAVPIILEIKSPRGQAEVRRTLDRHGAQSHVVVASALDSAFRTFRDGCYSRSASRREIAWWYFLSLAHVAQRGAGYSVLSIPRRKGPLELAAPGRLASAAKVGVPVHVWTIDDPSVAGDLWRSGASGIITNKPAVMVRLPEYEQSA